jgi:hypothetical protein
MTVIGNIHIIHDLDRGIILSVDTFTTSKYDGIEGLGENLIEALTQLLENVEALNDI